MHTPLDGHSQLRPELYLANLSVSSLHTQKVDFVNFGGQSHTWSVTDKLPELYSWSVTVGQSLHTLAKVDVVNFSQLFSIPGL